MSTPIHLRTLSDPFCAPIIRVLRKAFGDILYPDDADIVLAYSSTKKWERYAPIFQAIARRLERGETIGLPTHDSILHIKERK